MAGTLLANGMDSAVVIVAVEGTTFVSLIMADGVAIGSIITRTGQSTKNRTRQSRQELQLSRVCDYDSQQGGKVLYSCSTSITMLINGLLVIIASY